MIGIFASRRESEEDFMIAGRSVAGIQMIATITAGIFDGALLSVYIAFVYQFGLSALWFVAGSALGFLIFRRYAERIKNKADEIKAYSMPEFYYRIYGKRVGLMFSLFLVVQFFLYLIVNFILSAKILAHLFPGLSHLACVAIGAGIILIYLLLAGFKAVIRTDFFQFLLLFILCLTIFIFLAQGSEITPVDLNWESMGLGNVIGFLLLSALGIMVAPDFWQRSFAARDSKTLKAGFAFGALLLPLLAFFITVAGLATRHHFPSILAENALVTGISLLLPSGIKEFGLVLLFAVALSSADTVTFVVASIISRDLLNYSQKNKEKSARRITQIFMIIFVGLALIIASRYQNIMKIGFSLASLNLALFPVVLLSFHWGLDEKAAFWSLVVTFIGVTGLCVVGSMTPEIAALSLPIAFFSLMIMSILFQRRARPAARFKNCIKNDKIDRS
ncbi:MAG: hypothetical protein HY892_12375 [Deltaproteobacteria bacterium]|nr:hypothetical protein [Deltaproteobacteria bacterium]